MTAEFVKVGEEIEQGQTIATVGNTARFEIADEIHLHFEIKKDGNIYIWSEGKYVCLNEIIGRVDVGETY